MDRVSPSENLIKTIGQFDWKSKADQLTMKRSQKALKQGEHPMKSAHFTALIVAASLLTASTAWADWANQKSITKGNGQISTPGDIDEYGWYYPCRPGSPPWWGCPG
ncbi:MAG: hypothetical protein AAF412_14800 [Pseudomonadota bacterium]